MHSMGIRNSQLVVFLLVCFLTQPAQGETVNRIVAVVNDDVITNADVAAYLNALREDQDAPSPLQPDTPAVERMALQRLVEEHLILQEAKRLEVRVDPEEVLERYNAFRNRFGSDALFRRSLAESALSEEQLKRKIREQFMVQRVIDAKVRSTIVVSPQDVAQEIGSHPELARPGNRMRLSHLLVRVNEHRSETEAKTLIEQIHQQLANGAEFSTLAKRYSEDQRKADGGAMGWVAQGELMPALDAALANLKPGELSSPLQTRLGFHLVKVEEVRPASSLTLTEAHQAVYQRLYQEKFQSAFTRWLEDLKSKAYIEIAEAS